MYGWICACIEDLIISRFGEHVWDETLANSGVKVEKREFFHSINFPESYVYRIVESLCHQLQLTQQQLIFYVGQHFVVYIERFGLQKTLLCGCKTMREWLFSVGEPHRLMRTKFPAANLPEFRVEEIPGHPNSLRLHYYTTKSNFFEPLVEGICSKVADLHFGINISLEIELSEQEGILHHSAWNVKNLEILSPDSTLTNSSVIENNSTVLAQCPFATAALAAKIKINDPPTSTLTTRDESAVGYIPELSNSNPKSSASNGVGISPNHLRKLFPFHLTINKQFAIVQAGQKIESMFRYQYKLPLVGEKISKIFDIAPDGYLWSWSQLQSIEGLNISLVCSLVHPTVRFSGEFIVQSPSSHDIHAGYYTEETITFLIRPDIYGITDMEAMQLDFNDFPLHSFQRDIIVAGETLKTEIDFANKMTLMSRELSQQSFVAKQALKTKQVFVRYVSHEIRTPLNIAVLGLGYLEDKLDASVKEKAGINETIDEIKVSCSIAVEILNDFLLYEKIDDGIFNLSLSRVFFAPIVDESHKLFGLQARSANINFDLKFSSPIIREVEILVDRKKFYQVLRNLLSNAIKFTPEGGKVTLSATIVAVDGDNWQRLDGHKIYFSEDVSNNQPATQSGRRRSISSSQYPNTIAATDTVSVTSAMTMVYDAPQIDQCSSFLRLIVTDTGAGISVADQISLFHQFIQVQADKLQHGQGSGLGLWIASNIMRMHGGRIGVMSAGEGTGSHFVVDIPVFSSPSSISTFHQHFPPNILNESDMITHLEEYASWSEELLLSDPTKSALDAAASTVNKLSDEEQGDVDKSYDGSSRLSNRTGTSELRSCSAPTYTSSVALPMTAYPGHPATLLLTLPGHLVSMFEDETLWQPLRSVNLQDARVLIVDDALSNRKMMRRILSDKFTVIEEAENGRVAFEKFKASFLTSTGGDGVVPASSSITSGSISNNSNRPYDIIFMDGVMPVMDGLEATQTMRSFQFQQLQQQLQQLVDSTTDDSQQQVPFDSQMPQPVTTMTMTSTEVHAPPIPVESDASVVSSIRPLFHRTLILGVTGNGQDEDTKSFIDAGADYVFIKPLNIPALLEYLGMFFIVNTAN